MKSPLLHQKSQKLSLKKSLLWILISALFISGPAILGLFYYQHVRSQRVHDDQYKIIAIVQTTNSKTPLKTLYFSELLDLSIDHPSNLYRFSAKEGTQKILASPLIKQAQIKKIKPGTLYIDYTSREPIAFLEDFTNTAIDSEGYPFPFNPFFSPKKLPFVYLGVSCPTENSISEWNGWGASLEGPKGQLALSILNSPLIQDSLGLQKIHRIDVSRAYAASCGQREIIVEIEEQIEKEDAGQTLFVIYPRILRLNAENYLDGFANYDLLRRHLEKNPQMLPSPKLLDEPLSLKAPPTTIDLRIPHLAYMSH